MASEEHPEPLIVLAPPRSFSSVTAAMLGTHPEMYGLPEVHLFVCEDIRKLCGYYQLHGERRRDGMLRTIGELYLGGQTTATVAIAKRWIADNLDSTTESVYRRFVAKVAPKRIVEKSVSTVWNLEHLQRAAKMFPNAHYLHITRHPRPHGASMMETVGREWWLGGQMRDPETMVLDPQVLWLQLHSNIHEFLRDVPEERKRRVRGEDVILDPDTKLRELCSWLSIRGDAEAIDQMKHPERSPFAMVGPANAPFGADPKFLENPELRPARAKHHTMDAPLDWRDDGVGFSDAVRALANEFGYD